jgi:hypothetical protein
MKRKLAELEAENAALKARLAEREKREAGAKGAKKPVVKGG